MSMIKLISVAAFLLLANPALAADPDAKSATPTRGMMRYDAPQPRRRAARAESLVPSSNPLPRRGSGIAYDKKPVIPSAAERSEAQSRDLFSRLAHWIGRRQNRSLHSASLRSG